MWEAIVGFWFIVVGSWWTLLFLGTFVFWLVHQEDDGWAIIWLLVASAIAYHIFQLELTTFLMWLAAYIPIGVIWSFYRWRRYCNKSVEEYNWEKQKRDAVDHAGADSELAREQRQLDGLKKMLEPSNNISRLVQWIFIWPFSIIDNVIGDIYDMVVKLVKTHLISLYSKISSSALDKVK